MRRLFLSAVALLSSSLAAQSPFDGLKFRSIGPAVMGGRIHDVEVDPRDNSIIYIGAANGGMWKTVNKGTTWEPIFDKQADNAFGDIAIFPGDTRILWAGTGEQNNRQSSTWGGGMYRSTDAGATWTHIGLRESSSIGRVVAHPTDGNVAWVAAVGNLWRPNTERGVFKTTDAGRTWNKVLYVDSLSGAIELVMDPRDANVLYAATYQRLRSACCFNGGGPGSALWKTTDGGANWRKIETGLPAGAKGRIGISISRSNPNILVISVEHAQGGTFRSEDAGANWRRMSATNPRPMYYSKPTIDPSNDMRVWHMGVQPAVSEDGGATFTTLVASPTYDLGLKDDHHSLWIDPRDSKHLLLGGDGGLHESYDMGNTFARINNFSIGQFYGIGVDDRDPYWVYGGQQDSHSWMGPSATRHWLGILNSDWIQIGFSDGTDHAVDKKGHRYVYSTSSGGNLTRVDAETGDRYPIQPQAPAGESYRYDWTAPIVASVHTAGTVYLGANKLLISKDFGNTWTATKELTRSVNRDTMRLAGILNTDFQHSRNDGDSWSEISTMAESPVDPLVLWVGTDDGNVQVSKDGGKTWEEVGKNISGVPGWSFVGRVVASSAGRGTALVSFDNHRGGDFAPYIFRTTDFGKTWKPAMAGLPAGAPVRSMTEYPGKANVAFAGTERWLHFTTDSGTTWTKIGANLPPMRYDDMLVHPRTKDLVLGTHGRSIWILDDASPFAEWSPMIAAKRSHLFAVPRATLLLYPADVSTAAHAIYTAENPAEGATFTYHLSRAATNVKFTITNAAKKVIREITGPGTANLVQRVNWDLRYPPPVGGGGRGNVEGDDAEESQGQGQGGRGGRGAGGRTPLPIPMHNIGARGIHVSPGTYTVTMDVDGEKSTRSFTVRGDPMFMVTDLEHKARETFLVDVMETQARLQTQTTAFQAKRTAATGAEADRLNALATKLGFPPAGAAGGGRGGRGGRGGGAGPAAAGAIGGIIGGYTGNGVRHATFMPPTTQQKNALAEAKRALAELDKELGAKKP
jgi:photosystem II stability/assembly factor-like uncharacterized protein